MEGEGEGLEEPQPEIMRGPGGHIELIIDKVRETEFPIRWRRIRAKAKCYIQ